MKYFVFSDVHGCFDELMDSLDQSGYDKNNPDHFLLFLGDAFDHHKTGHYKMYQFLKENIENKKLTWIAGNHEIYLLSSLDKEVSSKFTSDTIKDIAAGFDSNALSYNDKELVKVLKDNKVDGFIRNNIINFFETDHYVFTHGFVPYNIKENKVYDNWRNDNKMWNLTRCLNGMKLVLHGIAIPDKTLVCGHVGAYYGNILKKNKEMVLDSKEFVKLGNIIKKNSLEYKEYFDIYYGKNVIGIDGRAYDTHHVNVLVIED